jgi:hypothetical protein
MGEGIEARIGKVAMVPLVVAALALAGDGSAHEKDIDSEYTPIEAVWAWYGQMHVDMGIAKVVCGKDSKHYDSKMCEEATDGVIDNLAGYINAMKNLRTPLPPQRYQGNR